MKVLYGLVATLALLWTAGWFGLSYWVDAQLDRVIDVQRQNGMTIACSDRSMRGFPFYLGPACDSLSIEGADGSTVISGAVRSSVSLTAPGEAMLELDGPVQVQSGATTLLADWNSLSAFIDATFDGGFDLASFAVADLKVQSNAAQVSAVSGHGDVKPTTPGDANPRRDLTLALALKGLSTEISETTTSPVDLDINATLDDAYRDLVERRLPWQLALADGASADIQQIRLVVPGEGVLSLAGPLQIGADGLVSGTVSVGLSNPQTLQNWALSVSPALEQSFALLAQSVAGMGVERNVLGMQLRAIDLTIDRGAVRLGFIKLIDLPPVNLR
ncbi:MAG: DUF2125 domain-containing protein [Ahrensia sp.]|nr:DUF2125 domain-containing protein [Ahrensia sp.]